MSERQIPHDATYTCLRGSSLVRGGCGDRPHAHLLQVLEWSALSYLCAVTFILLIDPRLPYYQKFLIGSVVPILFGLTLFYPLKPSELLATFCFIAAGFIGHLFRGDHYISWTISGLVYTLGLCLFWVAGRHSIGVLFKMQSAALLSVAILASCLLSVVAALLGHYDRGSSPSFLAPAVFVVLMQAQRRVFVRFIAGIGLVLALVLAYLSGWRAPAIIMTVFTVIVAGIAAVSNAVVKRRVFRAVGTVLISFVAAVAVPWIVWWLSEDAYIWIAQRIQARYEKLLDPYALNIELAVRIQETRDALRQFVEQGNIVTYLVGFGHGAAFDATTVRNMLGSNVEWWQDRFSESGDAHVIHFGLVRWLYRHGLAGVIFVAVVVILAVRDFFKGLYRTIKYRGLAPPPTGLMLIGAGSLLMFAIHGLAQPVEWDPMLWYSVGLWVYGRRQVRSRYVESFRG